MKYDVTLERIANCYYNLGLERAKLRDLSGAAELLKKALHYDKYQREARNLLGLIFFEMGEVADALVQWVISMNLLPEDNLADYYLDEIQRKPAILRICSDNVKRYNQALDYAQHNNEDLAVFQLNQVISDSPNYVKAHILLALLYMKRNDWVKAGKSLYLVLKIDRNNPKALVLMDIVKKNTNTPIISKSDYENLLKPHFNTNNTSTPSTPSTPSPTPSTPSTPTPPPSVPTSTKPQMYVISNRDRYITGKGVANSEIKVTLPDGTISSTTVSNNGDWNIVTPYLAVGSTVKAIQKENGKNNSEASVQTVVQAQDLVIGNNQLEFNVKTTVPVRVFIIFKGSSLGASMNMLGGNINVAGGTRNVFWTENTIS